MKRIIVSGFGGQGVLSLGLMLSYAAMKENLNTSFLPSYGPEMRGGTANCSVVVSEKEVASPVISRPDILVAFNEPSLVRFLPKLTDGGRVYVDSSAKQEYLKRSDVTAVPTHELCGKNTRGQNIVMLGAMLGDLPISKKSAEDAVREVFKNKPQFIDANLQCLYAGLKWREENK